MAGAARAPRSARAAGSPPLRCRRCARGTRPPPARSGARGGGSRESWSWPASYQAPAMDNAAARLLRLLALEARHLDPELRADALERLAGGGAEGHDTVGAERVGAAARALAGHQQLV